MKSIDHALLLARRSYATGGPASPPVPVGTPNIANNVTGGIHSDVPGRMDHLPISVPVNAFVIPADIVSAMGQGNTQAGIKALTHVFGQAANPASAGQPTDIMGAGGEFVVSPRAVQNIGKGDINAGHQELVAWVNRIRKQYVSMLKSIPGPKT